MKTLGLGALLLCFLAAAPLQAQGKEDAKKKATKVQKATSPFYGNKKCPISGAATKEAFFVSKGKERIYFCCKKCLKKGKADVDAAYAKAYPKDKLVKVNVTSCPIMHKPVKSKHSVTWQGYEVPLCCKRCVRTFQKQPRRYLTLALDPKLKAAKNAMCPVMDDEKVVRDTFVVYRGYLIGLCCDECIGMFEEDPEDYWKTLGLGKKAKK